MSRFTVPLMLLAVLVLAGGIVAVTIEATDDEPTAGPGEAETTEPAPPPEEPEDLDDPAADDEVDDPDDVEPDDPEAAADDDPTDPEAAADDPTDPEADDTAEEERVDGPGDDEQAIALPETGGAPVLLALAGLGAGLGLRRHRIDHGAK